MTIEPVAYQVRDLDLPAQPTLAHHGAYTDAVAHVQRLHEQFYDQLQATPKAAAAAGSARSS